MSTGSISAPLMVEMSPRCFICGIRLLVTRIEKGSTSDAHKGVIPEIKPPRKSPGAIEKAAEGHRFLFICANLLHKVGIRYLHTVTDNKDTVCITRIFHISAEDDRCILSSNSIVWQMRLVLSQAISVEPLPPKVSTTMEFSRLELPMGYAKRSSGLEVGWFYFSSAYRSSRW